MSIFYKLYENKVLVPVDPTDSFEGRNVIVTGSNVGLGFEAALKYAKLGASKLILAVRNLEKGNQAKNAIEAQLSASNSSSKCSIEVWELDMNSYDSIKAFVQRVEKDLPKVDVALLNAGLYMPTFEKGPYGWEQVVQVNTLSTVLLALLLLPKLKATKEATGVVPTLEFTSSGSHTVVKLSPEEAKMEGSLLEHFNKPENFQMQRQYAMSKLFLMCALSGMTDAVKSSESETPDAWCVSVCPGFCRSDLARGLDSLAYTIGKSVIFTLVGRTTEQGARSLVSGSTLGEKGHGEFWQHDKIQPTRPLLAGPDGEALKKRVWSEILDALAEEIPDVKEKARL